MESAWPRDLFLNEKHSDVYVRIDAELSSKHLVFPAHSLVLKRASPVFSTMLEGDKFKESRTGVLELKIPGHNVDAVAFLRYMYTKDLDGLDLESYAAILQAGHLYQVTDCVRLCVIRITESINACSACRIVDLMKCFEEYGIRSFCFSVIMRSAFVVFQRNLHLSLSQDSMCTLLSSDNLNVLDEDQVIEAVWAWGKARVFEKGVSVDEKVVEEISSLVDHVRWSLVKNTNKDAPWYEFTEAKKSERKKENVLSRKSGTNMSLIPHSRCCDVYGNANRLGYKDFASNEKNRLTLFSVNRDVLLLGFKLRIATTIWLEEDPVHFNVFLNDENTKDKVFFRSKYLSCSGDEVNYFSVICEFFQPQLIKSSRINSITLEDENPPALKKIARYELPKKFLPGDINFNFFGAVYAVHKLYYFL